MCGCTGRWLVTQSQSCILVRIYTVADYVIHLDLARLEPAQVQDQELSCLGDSKHTANILGKFCLTVAAGNGSFVSKHFPQR